MIATRTNQQRRQGSILIILGFVLAVIDVRGSFGSPAIWFRDVGNGAPSRSRGSYVPLLKQAVDASVNEIVLI